MKHASFILLVILLGSVALATTQTTSAITILSPACIPDPSTPSRNVLEITGNTFSSTNFSITSAVDNCHIYIHDLVVTSIVISSQIINNSNITIRNVTSSDKSIATFIWFTKPITNFSFVNISNVSHSSLSIDESTENDWISIIKFDGAITGKLDMTSWISISGLYMNNVACDRTFSSLSICQFGMIYFESSITNIASLDMYNFAMNNVSMNSSHSSMSALESVHFSDNLLSVQTISFKLFWANNVHVLNIAGPSQLMLVNFASTFVAAEASRPSAFTFSDISMKNSSARSPTGYCVLRLLSVSATVSNYNNIKIINVSAFTLRAISGIVDLAILAFMAPVNALATVEAVSSSSSSSSFVVDSVYVEDSISSAQFMSQLVVFTVSGAVVEYRTIRLTNFTAMSLSSTSLEQDSFLYLVLFSDAISCTSSSSSSSLIVDRVRFENISSTGEATSRLWMIHIKEKVTNFTTIRFAEIAGVSLKAMSPPGHTSLSLINFGSEIKAPISSSSSSSPTTLIINNIRFERASTTADQDAQLFLLWVTGAITDVATIAFSNVRAANLFASSKYSYSSVVMLVTASSVVAPTSLCSFSISNISMTDVTVVAPTAAYVNVFTTGTSPVQGFNLVNLSTSTIKNALVNSTASSKIVVFSPAMFDGCGKIFVANAAVSNGVSVSAGGSPLISILSYYGKIMNIGSITMNDNMIEKVSVSVPNSFAEVSMLKSLSFEAVKHIALNNNTILLSSSSVVPIEIRLSNVSVSFVPLWMSPSSSGFDLEVRNCSLEVQDADWKQRCTPANCSVVKLNEIQSGSNSTTISISDSKISRASSSFISFGKYSVTNNSNNKKSPVQIVLENNYFNYTVSMTSSYSFLGFDYFLPASSPFPSLVSVDMKCNRWPRIIDREYKQYFQSVVPSSKIIEDFIRWTCQTSSWTESVSQLSTMSLSPSIKRTSVSPRPTETKTADRSSTKSSSQTQSVSKRTSDFSMSISSSSSPSAIVPPPPYRSPLRLIYQTATTVTSLLSLIAMSSSSTLAAVRARSALHHFDDILYSNCGLNEESLASQEDEAADLSSSPTTMKLRDGGHLSGLVVGNLCFVCGIGIVWYFGHLIIPALRSEPEEKNEKKLELKDKKHQVKPKKVEKKTKDETQTFKEKLVASNAHQMMVLFTMLLLEPTLTAGATSLLGGIMVEGRNATIVSIVCVLLAWLLILIVGLIWPMWTLVYNRSTRYDEFEEAEKNEEQEKGSYKFPLRRFVEYMTDPSGEWISVCEKKKHKIAFELSVPFLEAFTPNFSKFFAIDLGIIVWLSLAEIVGFLVGPTSNACLVRGMIVCSALGSHTLLILYYKPLYTDRMSNTVAVLVEIISIVMTAGSALMNSSNDEIAEIEGWSAVAVAQSLLESMLMCLEVAAVLLPIWDWIAGKAKSLLDSNSRREQNNHNSKGDGTDNARNCGLTEMMLIHQNKRSSQVVNRMKTKAEKKKKKIMKCNDAPKLTEELLQSHTKTNMIEI